MDIPKHNIMILGGGLSGLAASMECQAPIYEAADRAGGVGASDTVDGFTFDRGIHVLNTKEKKFLGFLEGLGLDMGIRTRVAHIYSHGCYTAYPFQVNTAGLPIKLRMRCLWGYLRRGKNPAPENYADWMRKTIGDGFADTFLIPYSEKFWGVHPREMTYEWTGTKVPKANTMQVLRGALWNQRTAVGSNASFHYPENGPGYGAIGKAIEQRAGEIHIDHCAVNIDTDARVVTFDNGLKAAYEVLISTIPLPALTRITSSAPERVRQAAAKLRTNSILVVNLGIAREDLSDKHWIHFPEPDICFFRLSFPKNLDASTVPPGQAAVSVEVAYSEKRPINRDTIVERVIEDLKRTGILRDDDQVVTRHTHDIPYGYCIYDKARKPSIRTIRDWLDTVNIVPAGRYGLWSYFWSDEAIVSGQKSAVRARKQLTAMSVGGGSD